MMNRGNGLKKEFRYWWRRTDIAGSAAQYPVMD
jgi:hypothetical protein